jgi:uncharacterized protein (DUF608 family)
MKVGFVDLTMQKAIVEKKISEALRDPWLDKDTARDFRIKLYHRQKTENVSLLEQLYRDIRLEINWRKRVFGGEQNALQEMEA